MKKVLIYVFIGFIIISGIGLKVSNSQINNSTSTQNTTNVETTATNTTSDNNTVSSVDTVQPPSITTTTTVSTSTQSVTSSCIVTISGKQYDVIKLRKTHSGGDIFTCNTDMTSTFFSVHNQSLLNNQMSKYLVQ